MSAIAEIPILTPRSLTIWREVLPPNELGALQARFEPVRRLFASFLTTDDGDPDVAFLMASSRYAHLRLEIIQALLSIVGQAQLGHLLAKIPEFASELVEREGWRLGEGVTPLRKAWETYGRIISLLRENLEALSRIQTPPYGLMMALTTMDFSLTATAMYFEGEFPDAAPTRLLYLCRAAETEAATVERILLEVLHPYDAEEKAKILRSLFGSWQGGDELDEDLKQLYESRLYRSVDPS